LQLSKNFFDDEFLCPCCDDQIMAPKFINKLQKLRNAYGSPIRISNGGGYRCEKYNTTIGGADNSLHIRGLAVAIPCIKSSERYELAKLAFTLGFHGIGFYNLHIHIDMRKNPKLWIGVSK